MHDIYNPGQQGAIQYHMVQDYIVAANSFSELRASNLRKLQVKKKYKARNFLTSLLFGQCFRQVGP